MEENSEIKVFEHFYGNSKYNIVSELFVADNSKLEHYKIINQDISNSVIYHFFGNCKKNSKVKTVNFSFSDNPVRNEINLYLEGTNCDTTVASMGFGKKDPLFVTIPFLFLIKKSLVKVAKLLKML